MLKEKPSLSVVKNLRANLLEEDAFAGFSYDGSADTKDFLAKGPKRNSNPKISTFGIKRSESKDSGSDSLPSSPLASSSKFAYEKDKSADSVDLIFPIEQ